MRLLLALGRLVASRKEAMHYSRERGIELEQQEQGDAPIETGPRPRQILPSRPGDFHPEPLTDPDLILSHHPARATARRLPPSVERRAPPGEPVGPNQRR